jgi:hypothetical protein
MVAAETTGGVGSSQRMAGPKHIGVRRTADFGNLKKLKS